MTDAQWQEIERAVTRAIDLPPEEVQPFLAGLAADVRTEVESLLAARHRAGEFLGGEGWMQAATTLGDAGNPPLPLCRVSPGERLGPYLIERPLGSGGMGQVFQALDTRLGRKVAIKVSPERFGARFEREARAIAALNHPHVCTLYDVAPNYLVMELIEGTTLAARTSEGRLPLEDVLEIACQIGDALQAAHDLGIVHRDLKPANIMIRPDGRVKVLDFGIAKHSGTADIPDETITAPGSIMGTVRYMSPEQIRGADVDARSDIFSLGIVIYEMAAGRPPFMGGSTSDTMAEILKSDPAPLAKFTPGIPPQLQEITGKALSKDQQARYQSAHALVADLQSLARSHTQPAPGATAKAAAGPRKRFALLAIAALALLAGLGWWMLTARTAPTQRIESVAVLPFVAAGNDAELEFLSDFISENLINNLSQLPQLKVIASYSAFRYKGKQTDVQEVANALGVRSIVTGRVMRQGDHLLVSAEMVDVRDKTRVWGDQYDRTTGQIEALQGEIAQAVSARLRLHLTGAQQQQITKRGTTNEAAYKLYLAAVASGRRGAKLDLQKKVEYCNQAIAADPRFALAYTELSQAYDACSGISMRPAEASAKAKAALMKALEIDPGLAQAHETYARIKSHEWDWKGAEKEFKLAIQANPGFALAHGNYGNFLLLLARVKEALGEIQRAQDLDPENKVMYQFNEATALYQARSYQEAIQQFQNILRVRPDDWRSHVYLGYTYEATGRFAEAISELEKANKLYGDALTSDLCYIGYSYALWGKREEAISILNRLKTTKEYVSPGELAVIYIGIGDKESAFGLLERAYSGHDPQMSNLISDPHYDALRADQRFRDLVSRVGLPQ